MTKLEKKLLRDMLRSMSNASVTSAGYNLETGERTVNLEAARLIASADYRAGWDNCYERLKEYVEILLNAKPSLLKKQRWG